MKVYNKALLAGNISFLLKQKGIKIGTFEEQVNVSAGYLSRIIKDESIKPGIEFVVKAANILDISIDTLLDTDLSQLTATEQYFLNFINRLISETKKDHIEWQCERPQYLNNLDVDCNGNCAHPLFAATLLQSCIPNHSPYYSDTGYYQSAAFGDDARIDDECFNALIDDRTCLYIMHAEQLNRGDSSASADVIELWFHDAYDRATSFVGSTMTFERLKDSINDLYTFLKNYMTTPHLPGAVKNVIDSFMGLGIRKDDIPF